MGSPRQLPDTKKADEGQEPNHPKLSSDVPVRQSSEREENEPGKENPMFIVLREKVGNPEGAVRHFFKEGGGAIPFIQNGEIDTIFEDEKANQEGRRKDQHSFDKGGDRFGQHRSQLTLPLERERKKRRTCRRRGSNPHDLAITGLEATLL